ncbi:zinc-finger homeodomain protein 5-like [Typha angustifolia]|uniref:zinc-finger homeodomain protein 5-like n=1 Tax=Typha angustifolia TaxID=59011 RepID=UPI003C2BFF3F
MNGRENYGECLRNHAAAIGGQAKDGCAQFLAGGGADGLLCSACGCHRSFHRPTTGPPFRLPPTVALLALPAFPNYVSLARRAAQQQQAQQQAPPPNRYVAVDQMEVGRAPRTRARYTEEQKERMRAFAESVGWQMRRENEAALQRMCREIGVPRNMFKVWMHNNKARFAAAASFSASASAPPPE